LSRPTVTTRAIVLRTDPAVYLLALPGQWLLRHSTPSWRIKDSVAGFQRVVKEDRAREIARTVLDKSRTFPNAITLATTTSSFSFDGPDITLPANCRFLVVDGQHRLWAQHYSVQEGLYPCVIHMRRTEREMAELFLEINDNQRRVPSSLRWDLVRLVRSEDKSIVMTADIVYELATRKDSPFYSTGIDLTGERRDVAIKQGSLAPEIRTLLNRDLKRKRGTMEDYLQLFIRCFTALRSLDGDSWGTNQSTFFKARVLRAIIRVLADVLSDAKTLDVLTAKRFLTMFSRIQGETLSDEAVRKIQGAAGVLDLYKQIKAQVVVGGGNP
jgi:DGQHR domain-containing protein